MSLLPGGLLPGGLLPFMRASLKVRPTVDLPVRIIVDPNQSSLAAYANHSNVTVDPARSTVTVDA